MDRQKLLRGLLFILSLTGLAAAVILRSGSRHLSGFLISAEKASEIRSSREATADRLIRTITFNGYPLFPDEFRSAFYYSLVENDSNAFDPLVRVEGNSKAVRVALTEGEITPGTLAQNRPLQILVYDSKAYREYTVFSTTLPLMTIESEIESIHGTQKDRDLKMVLFDNRSEARDRLIEREGLIHVRGNDSTTQYPKQAYKMTLNQISPGKHTREADQSLLGMREDGEWILYADYNDQERIRNVFSSDMWFRSCAGSNEFGIRNGNEYRFVELFMNGKYWGLYAFGTPLDAKQMRPLKNTEEVQNVFVFKKSFWKEKYSDLPETLQMRDYEIKGEDTRVNEETARMLLREYDQWLLNGASGTDSGENHVRPDMGNAIDIWLYVNLVQGVDTVSADGDFVNMFLTLVRKKNETVVIYTPWDLDLTWGNTRTAKAHNNTVPYGTDAEDSSRIMLRCPADSLAASDPSQIRDRYLELRSGVWSDETLQAKLDGYEVKIFDSGAYLRDIEKWPDSTQEDPALKLSVFSDYLHRRLSAMDAFVSGLGLP